MISVIIPAHNEKRTVGRCLSALLRDAHAGELEIVVVRNGCSDGTDGGAEGGRPAGRRTPSPGAGPPRWPDPTDVTP